MHIKVDFWLTFWSKSKKICHAGISQWDSTIGIFLERKVRLFLKLLSFSLLFMSRKPAQPWQMSPFFVYSYVEGVTVDFGEKKLGTELF